VFKISIAKVLITALFLKAMLIMDFKRFISNLCSYLLLHQILKSDVIENDVIYEKSYDVFHRLQKSPHPSLSLCHTPSLFLNEIMKNRGLNETVCSMMKMLLLS
jgi:hypothetical protein